MVEIRLHGPLAAGFGKVWNLDVQTVQEAVQAIEANMAGFRRRIMELSHKGMVFRVRTKDHDYDNEDVHLELGSVKRIDIIPVILGASAGVRFVIGAVLVIVGAFTTIFTAGTSSTLIGLGLSLMAGSIAEWLTPKVKQTESAKGLQSWTISGPTNTVDQGLPVPVIYGEVLTGGYAISGGISVSQFVNGTTDPSVVINGAVDVSDSSGGGGNFTSKLRFSASTGNINDPLTYTWTKTGFAGASAVRLVNATSGVLTLEVDFASVADDTLVTYTGSITVVASGKKADNSGDTVTATATKAVSVSINAAVYVAPDTGGDTGPDNGNPAGATSVSVVSPEDAMADPVGLAAAVDTAAVAAAATVGSGNDGGDDGAPGE
jgi:predicted phage tail protein